MSDSVGWRMVDPLGMADMVGLVDLDPEWVFCGGVIASCYCVDMILNKK